MSDSEEEEFITKRDHALKQERMMATRSWKKLRNRVVSVDRRTRDGYTRILRACPTGRNDREGDELGEVLRYCNDKLESSCGATHRVADGDSLYTVL